MRSWIDLIVEGTGPDFIEEVLYHGTQVEFDAFDASKARTARHLYTSPDINTALYYGPIVYECRVRGPQADITENGDHDLIQKIAETYAYSFEEEVKYGQSEWGETFARVQQIKATVINRLMAEHADDPDYTDLDAQWDAEEDEEFKAAVRQAAVAQAFDAITTGNLYETTSHLQDAILEEVFALGFNSIRFTDPNSQGESLSVVAKSPADIQIIQRVR